MQSSLIPSSPVQNDLVFVLLLTHVVLVCRLCQHRFCVDLRVGIPTMPHDCYLACCQVIPETRMIFRDRWRKFVSTWLLIYKGRRGYFPSNRLSKLLDAAIVDIAFAAQVPYLIAGFEGPSSHEGTQPQPICHFFPNFSLSFHFFSSLPFFLSFWIYPRLPEGR